MEQCVLGFWIFEYYSVYVNFDWLLEIDMVTTHECVYWGFGNAEVLMW